MLQADLLCIVGTTATGKTRLAVTLAARLQGEIISADSRQVYKGMDLGTGKDLDEYLTEGRLIPYHLIDIAEPGTEYNLYRFKKDFNQAYRDVKKRGRVPILCGGTGMYIDAVVNNYRLQKVPENKALREALNDKSLEELSELLRRKRQVHNTTDITDKQRCIRAIEIALWDEQHPPAEHEVAISRPLLMAIRYARSVQRDRISKRLNERLQNGMIEEVKGLLDKGVSTDVLKFYGLEYRYLTRYLQGELSYRQMHDGLETAIHQFAKRQDTWWRRMEKKGTLIHWIPGEWSFDDKLHYALELLDKQAYTES